LRRAIHIREPAIPARCPLDRNSDVIVALLNCTTVWRKLAIFSIELAVMVVATFVFWLLLPVLFNSTLLLPFGIAATGIIFVVLRRQTRNRYLQYELTRRPLKRSEPLSAKWRPLLWLPSSLAVLMLLFFPVGSHIIHPSGHYLRHYRIPIPWNWTVIDQWVSPSEQGWVTVAPSGDGIGRFGVTTCRRKQPVSIIVLSSSGQTFGVCCPTILKSGRLTA
jgi:hypothetical protein